VWYVPKKKFRRVGVVAVAPAPAATAASAPAPTPAPAAGAAPACTCPPARSFVVVLISVLNPASPRSFVPARLLVCADPRYPVTPIGPPFTKPSFAPIRADPRCLVTLVSRARSCPLGFVFVCADHRYPVTLVRPSRSFTLVRAHLCPLVCIRLPVCADPRYPVTPNDWASV
jgi:hypothetical protein